jgi:RNA polymerase sigma factor (sigma-70 family)
MTMRTTMGDWQLLQAYATDRSEAAFAELVRLHLDWVYSVALRHVGDPQLAEDVVQSVFVLLARKARDLGPGILVGGWLFRTTRLVAGHARRAELRRKSREATACTMSPDAVSPDTDEFFWQHLAPHLDQAVAALSEADRVAILLRFYERMPLGQVGERMGISEEAARKRVSRALEKLREFLARRGVKLSGVALAAILAEKTVQTASAALATAVVKISLATASASALTILPQLAQETLRAWQWTKIKLAGSLTSALAAAVGVGFLLSPHHPTPPLQDGRNDNPPPEETGSEERAGGTPLAAYGSHAKTIAGQVLRLHVYAEDTGEAVANAQLAVNTVANAEWKERYDLTTDGTGTAEVSCLPGTGRLDVGVLSWGWAARFATWIPGRHDPIPAEYTLRVERVTNSMGGWLRDAQDRPVANAEITAGFHGTGDTSNRESPRERFGFVGDPVVAKSDARGWWTCAIIPPKHHDGFTLKANHPGFRPATIISGAAAGTNGSVNEALEPLWAGKLITHMEASPTLTGRVLDESGQPIAKALIAHDSFASNPLSVQTDANGSFSIVLFGENDFDFTVSAPGFAPEYRQVTIHGEMEPMEVRLKPGADLRLRVVDEQGAAVSGARVGLEQWGNRRHKLKWEGQSGEDGRIEWISAPVEEDLELFAAKDGWCYTRDMRLKADGEEHTITMRRALAVSGQVTDAVNGQALADFKAFPGYGEGKSAWERLGTRHGTDGQFTVQFEERRAPWRVRVEAEGYAPFVSNPLRPDFTNVLKVALDRLDMAKSIRGIVWRPDRRPAAAAEVALITLEHSASLGSARFRRDASDKLIATTDAQGRFSFSPDAKAHTVVAVSADGFARMRVRDTSQPLVVVLQPWGHIEGIIDATARVLPIESVVLSALDYDANGDLMLGFDFMRPDESGRFAFEFVPPETLCLYLSPGVGKSFHHRTPVTVVPGQTTSVVITNSGWRVKGRFTLAAGQDADRLKQVMAYLSNEVPPVAPPEGLSGDAAKLWQVDFRNSDAGRQRALAHVLAVIKPAVDGNFETEGAFLPGEYRLRVVVGGQMRIDRVITLTAPEEGGAEAYDLSTIALPEARQASVQ